MSNFSNRTDLIELIVGMLERLVVLNDLIPSATTRFHSLSAPSISINDYLLRIYKYVIVERAVLIQILVYLDRMCIRLPGFSFNSLTSHRFIITACTVACKAVSDAYCTNTYFAKVGGISVQELNILELDFCKIMDWDLMVSDQLLQQYYENLTKCVTPKT